MRETSQNGNMKPITEKSIIIVLLGIFVLLAYGSMMNNSATFDEPNYITAGYSYWLTADFRLNAEHPPLAKLIAGFPFLFLHPLPKLNTTSPFWTNAVDPVYMFEHQWELSSEFLYESGNDAEKIIFFSRLPFLLVGILLGIYIYTWAKELYGSHAGLLALFFYSFSPNMLAYTQLVITDLILSAFFFITVYYFWCWRKEKKKKYVIFCGVFFGLANASKFSAIYLIPVFGILLGIEWILQYRKNKNIFLQDKKQIQKDIIGIIIVFGIALFILAVTYLFVNISDYLYVVSFTVDRSVSGHHNYLLGEYSTQGWWYYFIVVFFLKTPSALLLLFMSLLLFLGLFKNGKETSEVIVCNENCHNIFYLNFNELVLIIPLLFYFIAFMFNHINIGIRHILPIYPFIFVFVSKAVALEFEKEQTKKWWHSILVILSVWYIISTILIAPHFLAFFNEFAGGPNNGPELLLDSNIDWSQDINRMEQWINKNNLRNTTIFYSVFTPEPSGYRALQRKAVSCTPHPGIFILSVNNLYDLAQKRQGCFNWFREREPTEKIGYSIFVYNITDPWLIAEEKLCIEECTYTCQENNYSFSEYIYIDHCVCGCK